MRYPLQHYDCMCVLLSITYLRLLSLSLSLSGFYGYESWHGVWVLLHGKWSKWRGGWGSFGKTQQAALPHSNGAKKGECVYNSGIE
ncbi:hypothetical protein DM02DRAFT_55631 [Periconia macrospinosa]|uniref:Uncharacterized protein n=1 Tax=Periconia macrospinosa TaxID=97972 RepID=A0A2V1E794_9PLEO|nr:hypothetical protein DM02DRAFT_55631 [Periconia macrospinosa]